MQWISFIMIPIVDVRFVTQAFHSVPVPLQLLWRGKLSVRKEAV